MSDRLRLFIPFIFAWLWSTGFVSTKTGLPYAEPFTLLALRGVCTVLVFAAIIVAFKQGFGPLRAAPQQLLVGFFLHGLHLGGVFFAVQQGMAAGAVAIIVGLQPILSAVLARYFYNEPLSKLQITGLGVAFTGLLLVIGPGFLENEIPLAGVLGALCGLIGLSVGTVLQKRMSSDLSLTAGSFYQFIAALAVMSTLSFSLETQVVEPHPLFFATLAWLVLGISVTAMILLTYMIREGAIAKVSAYFYLVTPLAVFQTWLFFGEALSLLALVGCGLAVFGVYLATRSARTDGPNAT